MRVLIIAASIAIALVGCKKDPSEIKVGKTAAAYAQKVADFESGQGNKK